MELYSHNTKLFKNIFPNYAAFKSWYSSLPLSDDENDCPSVKTFTLIAYEYNDSHVCTSPDSFKERFAKELYTYYKEFEATTKSIDDLMALKDTDISIERQDIQNVADIPELEASTDEESVDFLSAQTKMITKKGMLQVKREQLSNKRAYTTKTFINRFRHLFIKIISPAYTYVVCEPDGK